MSSQALPAASAACQWLDVLCELPCSCAFSQAHRLQDGACRTASKRACHPAARRTEWRRRAAHGLRCTRGPMNSAGLGRPGEAAMKPRTCSDAPGRGVLGGSAWPSCSREARCEARPSGRLHAHPSCQLRHRLRGCIRSRSAGSAQLSVHCALEPSCPGLRVAVAVGDQRHAARLSSSVWGKRSCQRCAWSGRLLWPGPC